MNSGLQFSFLLVALVALPLLLVGLGLVVIGRLGRRVGDHPHCRKCGYDLFGSPDAAACPECGSPTDRPVVGRRQRRGRMMLTGGVLTLIGLVPTTLVIVSASTHIDWQAMKPTWWLMAEAESSDGARAALVTQWFDGELSDGRKARLVELAFENAGTPSWQVGWEDVVGYALRDGLLDDDQLVHVADSIAVLTLRARPEVWRGMDADVVPGPQKLAGMGDVELQVTWQATAVTIDGRPIEDRRVEHLDGDFKVTASGWGGSASHLPTEPMTQDTEFRATLAAQRSLVFAGLSVPLPDTSVDLAAEIAVVDDPTANYDLPFEAIKAWEAVRLQTVETKRGLHLFFRMDGAGSPNLRAMRCFIVLDGREVEIPNTSRTGHGSDHAYAYWRLAKSNKWDKTPELDLPLTTTVILRTDVELAETHTDPTRVTPSLELRFHNVLIDPATATKDAAFRSLPDGQPPGQAEWLDPEEALRRNEAARD